MTWPDAEGEETSPVVYMQVLARPPPSGLTAADAEWFEQMAAVRREGSDAGGDPVYAAQSGAEAAGLSSDSLAVQRMAIALLVELGDGMMDGVVEVVRSGEGHVGEMMPLQIAPDFFDVVEFGGVFRQPLDRQPVRPLGERGACRLAGVDRAVVEREDGGLDRQPVPASVRSAGQVPPAER